ncbi:MAG: alpha/beta hydrolase-fold protein [Vicingaceae bacterium]
MKLQQNTNVCFKGANDRSTLLDEIYLEKGVKRPLLIFAHGFKGFKDWGHFPLVAEEFAKGGYYVIKFNFSHNGGTIDNPIDFPDLEAFSRNSYWKELQDIQQLLVWIKENDVQLADAGADTENISLLGHSRGGAISLIAAYQFLEIKRVITWASIANFKERLPNQEALKKWKEEGIRYIENGRTKQQMPMNYQFVEELEKHSEVLNIEKAVKLLEKPQLIIHGADDPTVNAEAALRLKRWNPQAELKIIQGAQHTLNGKHPWDEKTLPSETMIAVKKTIGFIKYT